MTPARALLWTGACQVIGFVAGIIAGEWSSSLAVLVHSSLSALAARFLSLSTPWIVMNALLPLGLAVSGEWVLPSWLVALLAIGLTLAFLPTLESGVPLYLSSRSMYEAIAANLPQDRRFTFVDLGCGTGGLLTYLARRFPQGTFAGIELGPTPFIIAWARSKFARERNIEIRFGSLWRQDLSPYDFVYTFLAPPPMPAVWEKATQEMKGGALLLSNSFPIPGVPVKEISVEGPRQRTLYVYTIKEV